MPKHYLHTFGCQMNKVDSTRMVERLGAAGYTPAEGPEDADLILLNTCAIREKAEEKLYSALGRYRAAKRRGALIGVAGCVAQQEKDALFARAPFIDFVLGPDQIGQVDTVVARVRAGERQVLETGWMDKQEYVFPTADFTLGTEARPGSAVAFVTAMKGCDNVCSFCVVPHTRGREQSRPYAQIIAEVIALANAGTREITLIGQNVNSYTGGCTFAELIRRVGAVDGVRRIRFTTSHPQDLSDALIACYAPVEQGGEPKLMPHLHLPVQSGSDRVLSKMRRSHTVAWYESRLAVLRTVRPDIALTSDIICGFPSETEEDFEQTMRLVERIGYDNLFSFPFSARPHTAAGLHETEWGSVPMEVRLARLTRLQAMQMAITQARGEALIGTDVEVLVEGEGRDLGGGPRRRGRTPHNRAVHFGSSAAAGALVRVRVERATILTLTGTQVAEIEPGTLRAERSRKLPIVVVA